MTEKATMGTEIKTLIDLFRQAVRREKSDQFNYKVDGVWQSVSTRDLDRVARSVAMGLHALGVTAESHVGLLSENRIEWIYTDLGILNCGASDVPIYATHAPKQISYILNDAGVEILFISTQAQYDRIREALNSCPKVRVIISFEPISAPTGKVMTFEEFLAWGKAADEAEPERYESLRSTVTPASIATLIYTSGTTGDPKGVVLTHRNLTTNVLINCRKAGLRENEVGLSFLPFSHIFERNWLYMYMHSGVTTYLARSVETVIVDIAEARPNVMTSVPRLYEKFYARAMEKAEEGGKAKAEIAAWAMEVSKEVARAEDRGESPGFFLRIKHLIADALVLSKWRAAMGGRLRAMVSGGAALSPELAYVFFGAGLNIYQGYGLTETSPTITTNYPGSNRIGSVGRPIEDVQVRIAEDGEILCSGPNVMRGYYNKQQETVEALETDQDGKVWFHTGDIGHLDADGFLYITDRKKDLLKTSGGKYIAPQPIENLIKNSRYINQVVVIGDDRKFPAAVLIPNFDALRHYAAQQGLPELSPAEMIEHPRIVALLEAEVDQCTRELSQYEKIKGILLLDHELTVEGGELTPTLKVRRRVVTDKLRKQIDRLYAEKEAAFGGK